MKVHVLIIVILVGIIPMSLFSLGFLATYEEIAITDRVNELEKHGNILATRIDLSGYLSNTNVDEINNEIDIFTDVYNGKNVSSRIIVINQNLSIVRDTYDSSGTNKTLISKNIIKCLKGNK